MKRETIKKRTKLTMFNEFIVLNKFIVISTLLMILFSCASVYKWDSEMIKDIPTLKQIKCGKSTEADVLSLLGKPANSFWYSDSLLMWHYTYIKLFKKINCYLTVTFNKNGIVEEGILQDCSPDLSRSVKFFDYVPFSENKGAVEFSLNISESNEFFEMLTLCFKYLKGKSFAYSTHIAQYYKFSEAMKCIPGSNPSFCIGYCEPTTIRIIDKPGEFWFKMEGIVGPKRTGGKRIIYTENSDSIKVSIKEGMITPVSINLIISSKKISLINVVATEGDTLCGFVEVGRRASDKVSYVLIEIHDPVPLMDK
jgi:hypothetical protein